MTKEQIDALLPEEKEDYPGYHSGWNYCLNEVRSRVEAADLVEVGEVIRALENIEVEVNDSCRACKNNATHYREIWQAIRSLSSHKHNTE